MYWTITIKAAIPIAKPKIFIRLKKGFKNTLKVKGDIMQYATDNLAAYKVPKLIEISDELPLTAVGKLDKKTLRKL